MSELEKQFIELSYEIVRLIEEGKISEAAKATEVFITISKKLRGAEGES